MPIIPDGYANVTLTWSLAGAAKVYSSVWACGDGTFEDGDAPTTATNWYDSLTGTSQPCEASEMCTGWVFDGVSVLQRSVVDGNMTVAVAGPAVTGTGSTGSPPQELVPGYTPMVITKRTGIAGRHGRGRAYPPLTLRPITSVDYNGVIDGSALGSIQTLWDNFFDAISDFARAIPIVTHNPIVSAPAPTPVTSLLVRPVVGSQRRRKVRGA